MSSASAVVSVLGGDGRPLGTLPPSSSPSQSPSDDNKEVCDQAASNSFHPSILTPASEASNDVSNGLNQQGSVGMERGVMGTVRVDLRPSSSSNGGDGKKKIQSQGVGSSGPRFIHLGPAYDRKENEEEEGEGASTSSANTGSISTQRGVSVEPKRVLIQGQEVMVDEDGAHVFKPGMKLRVPQWVLGEEGQGRGGQRGRATGGEMDEEEMQVVETHDVAC